MPGPCDCQLPYLLRAGQVGRKVRSRGAQRRVQLMIFGDLDASVYGRHRLGSVPLEYHLLTGILSLLRQQLVEFLVALAHALLHAGGEDRVAGLGGGEGGGDDQLSAVG